MRYLWRALGYLRRYWLLTIGAFLSLLISTVARLVIPRLTQVVIDEGIAAGRLQVVIGAAVGIVGMAVAGALFSFLQKLTPQASTDLNTALRHYATTAINPGPLLLISDLLDEGWREGLTALAIRGFEVTVLHLLSPDETDPPLSGDLKLLDVETGQEVEVTADYDLLARYRQGLTDWQEELRAFCGGRGMNYVTVTTDVPFEELILSFLRRRGVLR